MKGRLVQMAVMEGARVDLDLRKILFKRLVLTGSTLRGRSVEEKAALTQTLEERIWPQINEGKIKPVIDRVFPLEQVRQAHAWMESGRHIGKIVLALRSFRSVVIPAPAEAQESEVLDILQN
jgi:NADPH2:quinone reductase